MTDYRTPAGNDTFNKLTALCVIHGSYFNKSFYLFKVPHFEIAANG